MNLKNKTILLISPEPWSDMYVSKHHYALHLSKMGNKVYFLNPPSAKFSLNNIKTNLWVVDYHPLLKGLHWLPNSISGCFINLQIKKLEKLTNTTFDLVWNFDPSRFFNLSKINAYKVCHIVDWNQKFQRNLLAKSSDICFSTTTYLRDELAKSNNNSHLINHGYSPKTVKPISLGNNKTTTTAGYIGNLNIKYLDWSIIKLMVQNHLEMEFYFIGPYDLDDQSMDMKQVYEMENTHFVGMIPSQLIPSYLDKLDVLILVYLAGEYPIQLANPHKMLEYLSSGKPIVSTYTQHYEQYHDLISMSKDNSEYPLLFSSVISMLSQHNTLDLTQKRKSIAHNHTYEKQIHKIETLLNATISH